MSVGGKVIEVIEVTPRYVYVNTNDSKTAYANECAVYVDPAGNDIRVGDSLWWGGGNAYWTPFRDGKAVLPIDRKLKKIGYSGVKRPNVA